MEIKMPKKQVEDIGCFFDFLKSDSGVIEGFFIKPTGEKAIRYYNDKQIFIRDTVLFNSHGFTC